MSSHFKIKCSLQKCQKISKEFLKLAWSAITIFFWTSRLRRLINDNNREICRYLNTWLISTNSKHKVDICCFLNIWLISAVFWTHGRYQLFPEHKVGFQLFSEREVDISCFLSTRLNSCFLSTRFYSSYFLRKRLLSAVFWTRGWYRLFS